MNESNIRYYLTCEMDDLKEKIKAKQSKIKEYECAMDDAHKEIANLKVHYTSLLNTAIAYGYEKEDEDIDGG